MSFHFTSVAHFFASAAHEVTVGLQFLQKHSAQIQRGADKTIDFAATAASILLPQDAAAIALFQRGSEAGIGKIFEAIDGAKGKVTLTLEEQEVAEFQEALAAFRSIHPTGAVVPAGLVKSGTVVAA